MADWTDNPFAKTSNTDSPFADPSVTAAISSKVPEYNPFQGQPSGAASPSKLHDGAKAFNKPPSTDDGDLPSWSKKEKVTPVPVAPPAAVKTAPPAVNKNIDRQPMLVESRSDKAPLVDKDPEALRDPNLPRVPNFPPIPEGCRKGYFKPCYYLDIQGEIPSFGRPVVRAAFTSWTIYAITLLWNWICVMSGLAAFSSPDLSISCALASAYLLISPMCSYSCWFNALYAGVRENASTRFGWYFVVMLGQTVFSIIASVGPPAFGFSGIWFASDVYHGSKMAGILCYSCAGLWIFNSILQAYILMKALAFFRSSAMSYEQMKTEVVSGAVKEVANNKEFQQAAVKGAYAAMV